MTRATRDEWAKRVRRWRSSGLSARDFAVREGLNARTLSWWSSQLRRQPTRAGGFVEVKLPAAQEHPSSAGSIEVVLGDELRIRVSGDFDPAVLRRVVAVLEVR